jgi:hypothetical protein
MASRVTWSETFPNSAAAKYESKVNAYLLFAGFPEEESSMSVLAAFTGRQTQVCHCDR